MKEKEQEEHTCTVLGLIFHPSMKEVYRFCTEVSKIEGMVQKDRRERHRERERERKRQGDRGNQTA